MTPLVKKVFELFGKPELADETERRQEAERPSPWPCRRCGRPAVVESVEPSLDGTRMLTYWRCPPCKTSAVTPDTIKQPPVWVSSKEQ